MRIGIDFGTTNSSVAHYDGQKLTPIPLDPVNENPYVLPSLIWINQEYQTKLGTAAANEYLARETGRRIVWAHKDAGAIEMIVGGSGSGPIRYMHEVSLVTDVGATGRLLQSVKTALRDPRYKGTDIFERYYSVDELIAMILQAMKHRAEKQLGSPCDSVVLGRPVRFSDDPAVDTRAEDILFRAARFAGFEDITFQMEPIAAAHLYHITTPTRQHALVFDFGGGTLDLTIAEVGGASSPHVIATRGVLLGGDDIDRRIMRSLLKYFGAGTQVTHGLDFPPDFLDLLQSWQTMPELSRPHLLEKIREFQKTSTNPRAMLALESLVTQNIGFKLFREIEQTKKLLTYDLLARLDFAHQHVDIHERILRRDFELMIEAEVAGVQTEIQRVLADARMRPEQINVVLRTGGTSLIPAFVHMLESIFGPEKIQEMDPLTSVVGGMAVVAHQENGAPSACAYRYESPFAYFQATSGREYRVITLRTHRHAYTDRDYTILSLPLELSGAHAIQPADLDYDSEAEKLIRFKLKRPCKVYVIYQAKVNHLPKWLRSFKQEPNMQVDIITPGGRYPFAVYSRELDAGAYAMGGAHAQGYSGIVFMNYIMAVRPL
ncbi:MAG TPA: Hsp70 family protein [Anaerolineae bacterium]|nr:Hsp70 family protein [Anaerolineae bacterium]